MAPAPDYHLLIVDDSEEDRETCKRLVDRSGDRRYLVAEADTGEVGLSACQTSPPDCLLLDFNLPDMTGIEFLDRLGETAGSLAIPTVMLTGFGNEAIAVAAMKRGAQDYVTKGHLTADLLHIKLDRAIETILQRRAEVDKQEAVQRFAHTAAHDLKSPLTQVQSICLLLKEQYSGRLDDQADEFLGDLLRITGGMGSLVDGLLTFAKSGRPIAVRERVELTQVIVQAVDNLRHDLDGLGARVNFDLLPTVGGSAIQLLQVFQNLISNAIKFGSQEDPVVSVSANLEGKDWHFRVEDSGIGVDPKFHDTVFEPLNRLQATSVYPGTGIGLATCKTLIDKHQGKIWIESKPGEGTTVHFTLPALA